MSIFANLPRKVRVVEVGPRDGLQNERSIVTTDAKLEYISLLAAAGLKDIEVTSFVSAKRVPQLADADLVCARLQPQDALRYTALVPNRHGLERALHAGIQSIALFTAASDTFVRNNIGMSISDSISLFEELVPEAKAASCRVRIYISTAFYCPFEGKIDAGVVHDMTKRFVALGVDEISLGDTIGQAVPTDVSVLLDAIAPTLPLEKTAMHFHDTRGAALANVLAALQSNVSIFDAASGGLGGCPFSPGASGNLATEDLVLMLTGMGIETGVDAAKIAAASRFLAKSIEHPLPGKALQYLTSDFCTD